MKFKKNLIIAVVIGLIFIGPDAWCQTKQLPAKINIELSDREYLEFYRKVDSLMGIVANTSNVPATFINPFLSRFGAVWMAIDHKVALQMVDTTKVKPVIKK